MPVIEATASAVKERSNGKEQMAGHAGDDGAARPAKRKRLTPSATRRAASAVTSGRKLFVLGDSNSAWSRRYADLVRLHAQDMSGGLDLSQAQQSLIRRAAAIECELELMEGRLSLGEPVDLDLFTRSSSHLRRLLETLGIKRVPHDVMSDLATYLTSPDPNVGSGDATSKEPHVDRRSSEPHYRSEVVAPEPHDIEAARASRHREVVAPEPPYCREVVAEPELHDRREVVEPEPPGTGRLSKPPAGGRLSEAAPAEAEPEPEGAT